MDRKQHKTYTKAAVSAINDYFERQAKVQADPYLETREKEDAFLQRVVEAVQEGARETLPQATTAMLMQMVQSLGNVSFNAGAVLDGEKPLEGQGNPMEHQTVSTQEHMVIALAFADCLPENYHCIL